METITLPRITPPAPTKPTYFIDASILKKSSCMREVIWTIYNGYQAGPDWNRNYKAGYGSAFHRGLELYYSVEAAERSKIMPKVLEVAQKYYEPFTPFIPQTPKEFRTTNHLISSILRYEDIYGGHDLITPVKSGKETGLMEIRFLHPYKSTPYYDVVLTGTIDMVGEYLGELCLIDHKSTSAYDIKQYMHSYKLNIQTRFYTYIFELMTGKRLPFLINGIFLKKDTKKGRDNGEPFDGVHFERSDKMMFNDEQMAEFIEWLEIQLSEIEMLIYHNTLNNLQPKPNFAACQQPFGLCKFYDICALPKSLQESSLALLNVKEYNPLHFSD